MELNDYFALVEQTLTQLGINPEDARGAEPGQWLVYRQDTEIYIDIWQPGENNHWNYMENTDHPPVFQVISPVFYLPSEQTEALFDELLQINFNLMYASFIINKAERMVAMKFRRPATGLSVAEITEAIDSVGYYAEFIGGALQRKYAAPALPKN